MYPVKRKERPGAALHAILDRRKDSSKPTEYLRNQVIFAQGSAADWVFYIEKGKVKLVVSSPSGKEAVIGICGPGEFVGESCLADQSVRTSTALALSDCSVLPIARAVMARLLQEEPLVSEMFLAYVLSRKIRIEEDLVDQLFNSSEKRLARLLLLLANFGKEGQPEQVIPRMSQETLAGMVGTTRSRVSFFMNRFRKLGLIEYDGEIRVHSSLLNVVLRD